MYAFTFGLLAFFAFNEVFTKRNKYHIIFVFIAISWLIFHDGFRWGIGTDWEGYYNYFINCLWGPDEGLEIGYVLFNQAIRSTTSNYSIFLILHAIIVYLLISKSIFKYSVSPLFSIFLFYCLMLTYLGMNRQYIAFAVCLFSLKYIFERKFLHFIFCIFLAFLFHRSSLMFFFAYFISKEISTKYLIGILLFVIAISVSGIMNKLPLNLFFLFGTKIDDKIQFYLETDFLHANILYSILAILKRSMWLILAFAFKNGIKNKDQYFNFFLNAYFISTVIYILFNNTLLQVIVSRGLMYYNISEIFLIPYLLTIFKDNLSKKIVFFLILIYCILIINKSFNFYKKDLGTDIFRPYNSILIDDTYNAMNKF